ncbi:MFS transporter [Actinomyces sp. zg-332]|uniref:MFS transporter n=1 Tax=Actinomyces sp. zg-332 TaxID=2708340 RepID=UPI00141E9E32|nr:MFS transporter [Actinomyces sp. zg-332]QPK94125.1 MFS transporter [Actinomyces sp. zg-332]
MKSTRAQKLLFLVALFWLAIILRSIIATLPPVLPTVQHQLNLSNELAGATTTIPLICFGVFAFVTPSIQKRLGITASMTLALVLITIGTLIRALPYSSVLIFSSLCIGIGTSIANVLFAVTLRAHYPHKIAWAMGIFTFIVNIGSGIGAMSVPFLVSYGFSWNLALSLWSIPSVLTIFFWLISHAGVIKLPSLRKKKKSKNSNEDFYVPDGNEEKMAEVKYIPMRELLVMPLAWTIALFMGIQSLIYYNFMTWLPTIFESTGFSVKTNSILFTTFNTIAIFGSLLAPFLFNAKNYKLASTVFYGIYIITALCFPIGGTLAIIASVIAGICQGVTYPVGLTLIASHPDKTIISSISAFTQGVGYIIAAIGPILMGALYSLSGNWWVPTFSIVIAMVLNCLSFIICRKQMNEASKKYNISEQ